MLVPSDALQPKPVQSGLPAPALSSRPTGISAPISRPESPSQNLPFAEIFKKAAANLVQVLLNPFTISIFPPKIASEKREKTTQNRYFSPLFSLFRPFLALFLPSISASSSPSFALYFSSLAASLSAPVSTANSKAKPSPPRTDPRRASRPANAPNRPEIWRNPIACQEGPHPTLLQVHYFSSAYSQRNFADNLLQIA